LTLAWLAALAFGAPCAAAAVSVRVGRVDQDGRFLRVLLATSSAVLVDEVGCSRVRRRVVVRTGCPVRRG
jgi:hypothetical protein